MSAIISARRRLACTLVAVLVLPVVATADIIGSLSTIAPEMPGVPTSWPAAGISPIPASS